MDATSKASLAGDSPGINRPAMPPSPQVGGTSLLDHFDLARASRALRVNVQPSDASKRSSG